MERWQNCVAVVTGASSGIGEACARLLVQAGLRVVALARREERLNQNRNTLREEHQSIFFIRKCDITNEEEVKTTFAWIEQHLGGTDILVNNAACMRSGNIIEMDTKLIDDILNTNLKGAIYCTQAAFKSMKKRNFAGHLVHINSVLGQSVIPFGAGAHSFNAYPVSKFALTALNEVIRQEMTKLNLKIKTTSIHPGKVRTEIADDNADNFGYDILSPDEVAETVMYVISTPPKVSVRELTVQAVDEWF